MPETHSIVVTDTNIVVNLVHVGFLDRVRRLPPTYLITDQVNKELSKPRSRAAADRALRDGDLTLHSPITDIAQLARAGEFRRVMQKGEAESLAVAEAHGWLIAGDERKTFRPAANEVLGPGRIVTTAGLIMQMLLTEVITLQEADAAKAVLERNGYKMSFDSFSEFFIGVPSAATACR